MQNKDHDKTFTSYQAVTRGMTTFVELTFRDRGTTVLKGKNEIKTMIRMKKAKGEMESAEELQKILDVVFDR